jgi:hypothetical protein
VQPNSFEIGTVELRTKKKFTSTLLRKIGRMKFPKPAISNALLPAVVLAFLTGCQKQTTSGENSSSKPVTESRQSIQASDLDSQFLDDKLPTAASEAKKVLNSRKSLMLNGTTLTVGPVGGHRTLTIVANNLSLLNGAKIITNGNNLVLIANSMDFNNSAGIVAFSSTDAKADLGKPGADGGRVEIFATSSVSGAIHISLVGQNGGDGTPGVKGAPGARGTKGSRGVDHVLDCASGAGKGGTGATGGTGTPGAPGNQGGDGGQLVLRAAAIPDHDSHFVFERGKSAGGSGGAGGAGGDAGPGGEGGDKSTYCGPGQGGDPGQPGSCGAPGGPGAAGKPSGDAILEQKAD